MILKLPRPITFGLKIVASHTLHAFVKLVLRLLRKPISLKRKLIFENGPLLHWHFVTNSFDMLFLEEIIVAHWFHNPWIEWPTSSGIRVHLQTHFTLFCEQTTGPLRECQRSNSHALNRQQSVALLDHPLLHAWSGVRVVLAFGNFAYSLFSIFSHLLRDPIAIQTICLTSSFWQPFGQFSHGKSPGHASHHQDALTRFSLSSAATSSSSSLFSLCHSRMPQTLSSMLSLPPPPLLSVASACLFFFRIFFLTLTLFDFLDPEWFHCALKSIMKCISIGRSNDESTLPSFYSPSHRLLPSSCTWFVLCLHKKAKPFICRQGKWQLSALFSFAPRPVSFAFRRTPNSNDMIAIM